MLSYRHAFHAGNHADVLKHTVLLELLAYLQRKEKPFTYIDTHAGAGLYALDRGYAAQNAEYAGGIGRLWERNDLPPALFAYREAVRDCNPGAALLNYPGSPWLAHKQLRADDRTVLFELHGSDEEILRENFRTAGREVRIEADGFAGIKSYLPPPTRRGLVLIDPPYEEKRDYQRVVSLLAGSLKRFATGTYALWYPQLQRAEAQGLPVQLLALNAPAWLHVTLSVQRPAVSGFGMHGSGLFIINPPYTLPATLQGLLPYLVQHLGLDSGATYTLHHHIP
jgi:23S rRNA (adenine2030-N6)-methyltransferase